MELEQFGFKHSSEILNSGISVLEDLEKGKIAPLKTRINVFNTAVGGIFPNDQITICGDNSIGVSSRVLTFIEDFLNPNLNPKYEDGIIVLYHQFQSSNWRTAIKLLSNKTKESANKIIEDIDKEKINKLKVITENYKIPLYITNKAITGRTLHDNIKKILKREEYEDYLIINVVDDVRLLTRVNYINEENMISEFMFLMESLKNNNNVINILVNKLKRTGNLGQKLPIDQDIIAHSAVLSSSDLVIACHRPGFYNERDFRLGKNKISTGISEGTDDLWIETILRNRYNTNKIITFKHNIQNGEFRDFNKEERARKFTEATYTFD